MYIVSNKSKTKTPLYSQTKHSLKLASPQDAWTLFLYIFFMLGESVFQHNVGISIYKNQLLFYCRRLVSLFVWDRLSYRDVSSI